MTISSTIGYGVLPLDPAVPTSSKSIDPFELQASDLPTVTASTPSAVSSQSAGLLSSSTIAEVLKLTDAPSPNVNTMDKPLYDRGTLLEAVKQSKAYASGDISATNAFDGRYTSKDLALIRQTTGYNVVSNGKLTTIVDDNGNPPPADISDQVWNMAGHIEISRMGGALTGEITPEYLKDMFDSYAKSNEPFPQEWLDKALDYLGNTTDQKR